MAGATAPADTSYPGSRQRAQSIGEGHIRPVMQGSKLWRALDGTNFWKMPEDELLFLVRDEFPAELDRLKNAYSVRSTGATRPSSKSISERIYNGSNYDEINRTLLGVLALRWIINNDYESFISGQKSELALKRESFDWLHNYYWTKINTADDAYALVLSMIINDLGKDPNLAKDYARLTGNDISNVNHDMILYHAIEGNMVPALTRLTPSHLTILLDGIRLGAELNFGQLAQAENAPASLTGLLDMHNKPLAFQYRFMEQILDVSAAKGHENWTAPLVMVEPVFQSYRNVHDVATGLISGTYPSLRAAFDVILTRKLLFLSHQPFPQTSSPEIPHPTTDLTITNPTHRALARLLCLANASTPPLAHVIRSAFLSSSPLLLPPADRATLVRELNRDGDPAFPAIQPTYAPAMLAKALANTPTGSEAEKVRAAAAMLRYLAKVLGREVGEGIRGMGDVSVVEREVRCVDAVVGGEVFMREPEVLVMEGVPEDRVANRLRRA